MKSTTTSVKEENMTVKNTESGIICGKCRKEGKENPYHATTADVRTCYTGNVAPVKQEEQAETAGKWSKKTFDKATESILAVKLFKTLKADPQFVEVYFGPSKFDSSKVIVSWTAK